MVWSCSTSHDPLIIDCKMLITRRWNQFDDLNKRKAGQSTFKNSYGRALYKDAADVVLISRQVPKFAACHTQHSPGEIIDAHQFKSLGEIYLEVLLHPVTFFPLYAQNLLLQMPSQT